jgi:hypothetical protein
MRALGCVLALDDVGGASDSLPMMAVLAPEVVRLDLAELAQRPEDDLAVVVDAVAAHAERAGATVLVERVETPEQARLASTLGARLAQGWLFGRRESLVSAPAPPAERQVQAAFHPDPRDTTPFQILAQECAVRRAGRTLLTGLGRHLEDQARAMGRNAIIVGAFTGDERFDADARRRYADLARARRPPPRRRPARPRVDRVRRVAARVGHAHGIGPGDRRRHLRLRPDARSRARRGGHRRADGADRDLRGGARRPWRA